MKKAEELELFEKYAKGNKEAYETLTKYFLPEVITIAKSFHKLNKDIPMEDLVQEGCIGLIKAMPIFARSPKTYGRFCGMAREKIKSSLIHFIANQNEILETRGEIEKRVSKNKYTNLRKINLEELVQGTINYSDNFIDVIITKSIIDEILKIMNENPFFSENRKKVLMHTYGINNCEVLTQTELASLLGITATRIQQLDEENIEKLRELFIQKEFEWLLNLTDKIPLEDLYKEFKSTYPTLVLAKK